MATIVVIEDHPPSREFLTDLLRYNSHRVIEAADGREGLEVVRRERPDLVFTDILMPTMDGFEFARRLREDPQIASTPLIFYSASYHGPEAQKLAASCGVARFLSKPADSKAILAAVDEILAGKTAAAAAPSPVEFDRDHVRLVTDELARNVTELRLATQRLDALVRLGVELSSQRDPAHLFDRLCEGARVLIGARHACVAVIDEADEPAVRHYATSGLAPEILSRLKPQPVQEGIVGRMVREPVPRRIAGPSLDARSLGLPDGFPALDSLLAVPIASGRKVYGCLCLTDRLGLDEFTERDEDIAGVLGTSSGTVYESLLRFDEVRQAEERYHSLFDRMPVGLLRSIADGRIVEVNPALVEMLGFPDAEHLKQTPAAQLYADPRQRARMIELLDRERVVRNFELQLRRHDETRLWCELSGRAVTDPHGLVPYYETVVQDITERKRAQYEREERERLALFAAEIGAAVTEIDDLQAMLRRCAQILVDRLDAAFARIWTLNEAENVLELQSSAGMYTHIDGPHGRVPVGALKIGLIASQRRPHLTNVVIGDPRIDDQEWARRERMVAFAGYPLAAGERLLGVMAMFSRTALSPATHQALGAVAKGVALGIETRKRATALREALRWANESDRLKTAFLANMSHEIRTPLNVILGYAEILRSELGTEEEKTRGPLFDGIKRGSDRLLNTMQSVLDVARLEAGTFRYQPRPILLRELIEEVSEPFESLARTKGLAFRLDVQEPAATVGFDPYCLSHTLRHLLDNAIKFTAAGAVTLHLRRAADRHLVLEVEDTGAGIEEAFQSRLFETFSQEDSGYTRPFEGAGLGLALAKRFLALGNARILVSSRKGAGTTAAIHFEIASEVAA